MILEIRDYHVYTGKLPELVRLYAQEGIEIQKEIDEVKGDTTIPEKEKKQMLEELAEALKTAQPIQHPENIELVKKYWEKIDAVLQ